MTRSLLVSFAMTALTAAACSQQGVKAGGTGGAGGDNSGTGGSSVVSVASVAGVPNDFGETLSSSFFMVPCYSEVQQDCVTIPTGMVCPNQAAPTFEARGFTQTEVFTVGGVAGAMYNLTFTVNGITEAKYYTGGTRDAGMDVVANAQDAAGTDTFYRGGAPVAQEFYNVYKIVVKDTTGTEVQHYYLNSFPQTTTAYENHQTFPIHYQKTIAIVGGGTIEYFLGDSNCRAVDNCGPGVYAGTCTASRNIPSEPNLVIPTTYMGKNVTDINLVTGATQPFKAQLIHITVDAVEAAS